MLELWIKAVIEWMYIGIHWLLLIPLVSGLIGWLTNVIALQMTFYPLYFKGIGRIGWQGIIPARASQMAALAVDLILERLIDMPNQFKRIKAKEITELHKKQIEVIVRESMNQTLKEQAPLIWKIIPLKIKEWLISETLKEIPTAINLTIQDIQNHIEELLDIKAMVITQLEADKNLLNQIFMTCGYQEFQFIKRSGFYFGFLLGSIQMLSWYHFNHYEYAWLILPIGGLLIGFLTNWLALKLIFHPIQPIQIGNWTIQGLFLKRQKEVAILYASLVAKHILTPTKMVDTMIYGNRANQLHIIIQENVEHTISRIVGIWGTLFQILGGYFRYHQFSEQIGNMIYKKTPIILQNSETYIEKAIDIENTIQSKMSNLTPEAFISFLRPIFKADEWKLILVGTILGGVAGVLQLFFLY